MSAALAQIGAFPVLNPVLGRIRRHPLVSLFLLAYGFTWLGAVPFALGAWPVPMFPFGPLVAAFIVAAACGGWPSTKSLLRRMIQWRVAPRWYAFALVVPAGVTLCAAYVNVLAFGAADPTTAILGALPGVVPGFALMMLNPLQGSLGEEPAWRGLALPRLLSSRSPLVASLMLAVLVAGWHAPLFATGIYTNAWLHILFIVTTTVLYTLVHNGSGGSVLLAMAFHTGWNLMPEVMLYPSFTGAELHQALTLFTVGGITVSVLATIVAWRWLTGHRASETLAAAPGSVTV
jgi:uncharacterized protein